MYPLNQMIYLKKKLEIDPLITSYFTAHPMSLTKKYKCDTKEIQ